MEKRWHYVNKDGNPKEEGTYITTLIYNEFVDYDPAKDNKPAEKKASVETREYVDLDKNPDMKDERMNGEPETGLAWLAEDANDLQEKVWAWMPIEKVEIAELPEGVTANEYLKVFPR